jgi:hypothetical protein
MLNVYKYHDDAKTLLLYDKLNDVMSLLEGPTWWQPSMKDQLEPLIPIIIKSSELSFCYASFVLENKRFPEGEPAIMKDRGKAYSYARHVLKGRWKDIGKPEVEDMIMQDPHGARLYATYVIKGRWPEAEPNIAKYSFMAYQYAYEIIKGRFPEAESVIMKDPEDAYNYALHVLKCRWTDIGKPEAEEYIKKDKRWWSSYKEDFGIE